MSVLQLTEAGDNIECPICGHLMELCDDVLGDRVIGQSWVCQCGHEIERTEE